MQSVVDGQQQVQALWTSSTTPLALDSSDEGRLVL